MLNSLGASYNPNNTVVCIFFYLYCYKAFSNDDKSAKLVSQNNETMVMLVSLTSPVGLELFCFGKPFCCSNKFT